MPQNQSTAVNKTIQRGRNEGKTANNNLQQTVSVGNPS